MKKKRVLLVLIAVLGIIAIITGVTYAFFSFTKHGSTENVIRTGSIAFHYDEISGKGRGINLIDALPADSDEEEKSNNNYFDFKITAESDIAQIPYTVTAKLSEDTTLDLDVIKVYLTEIVNGEETPILYTTLDQLPEVTFKENELELYKDTVPVNGSSYERKFRLRMWMAEDTNFISGAYSNKKLSLTVNVYTNQGSKLTEEHLTKSDDTSIKMISGNNTYLLNKSEETNIDYEVNVPNEVNTINLDIMTRNIASTTEVEELGQTLSYNDNGYIKRMSNSNTYNLLTGDNYFKATVTSADNTKTTNYNIKVFRELSKDNTLTYLGVEGYSFTEEFDKDTLSYETVGLEVDKVTLTGNKGNEAARIDGLGTKNIVWGKNSFQVTVTPEDPTVEARTYTIVVNKVRPGSPSIEATTNEWTATNPVVSVGIQGTAISGIDHYEVYKTTSTDLPTDETEATATTDNEYVVDTDGVYHIYYRTVSTNGNKSLWSSGVEVKRDTTGPSVPTSGSIGTVSGTNTTGSIQTVASGSEDAGVGEVTYKYLVTNTNTEPSKDDTNFTEALTFTRSCGTSYYAWAIAEDSLGNRSEVASLGNTSDGKNSYNAWGACSEKCGATGTQTRTNTCALVTTELSQSCTVGTTYKDTNGKWGTCSKTCGGGTQSYTVTRTWYSNQDNSVCSQQTGVVTSSQACNTGSCCAYAVGKYWDYNYTGGMQSFTVPCNGTYQIQVYGAQGGTINKYGWTGVGGYGGYAIGNASANANTVWYIGVGGQGSTFNGGGTSATDGTIGGGATHVGTRNGTIAQYGNTSGLLIVAGGGGSGSCYGSNSVNGGAGGGTNGSGVSRYGRTWNGGTQSGGGTSPGGYYDRNGSFGQGAAGGGGGGLYGGAGGPEAGGAGGSGYIGGVSGGSMANGQRAGNGFARITLKSISN